MLLELSEILACPVCGPPQVLVAVVHAAEGRRVQEGFLGCPACEARFPVADGVVSLVAGGAAVREEPPDLREEAVGAPADLAGDTPVLLAALLGLEEGRGPILLSPGLAGVAARLAELAPSLEVIQLLTPVMSSGASGRGAAISRLAVAPGVLPFLPGRVWGVGLAAAESTLLAEAARLLVPGGRVAVVRPPAAAPEAAERAGLEVLAVDTRALVATLPVERP